MFPRFPIVNAWTDVLAAFVALAVPLVLGWLAFRHVFSRMLQRPPMPAKLYAEGIEPDTTDVLSCECGMYLQGEGGLRFPIRVGSLLVGYSSYSDAAAVWRVKDIFYLDGQWRCLLEMQPRQRDKLRLPGLDGYSIPTVRRELTQFNQARFRLLHWSRDTALLAELLVPPHRGDVDRLTIQVKD